MTECSEDQLVQIYTDSLPKKKDPETGEPTDELTSKSKTRLDRIMNHTYKAPGASTEGGLTIWSGQQAASYDATHLYSNQTGLEGMEFGAGGKFMDRFTANANRLFVGLQANVTEEAEPLVYQAVKLFTS